MNRAWLGFCLAITTANASVSLLRSPDEPGPNKPPVSTVTGKQTHSLLDYLLDVGPGGIPRKTIYPFSELMQLVAENSNAQTMFGAFRAVLMPFSRALERQYASYKYPRALLAVDTYPRQTETDLGLFLKDRLFIGHSFLPNVLEVISENPETGRDEFQLVKNYGEGLAPQVVYANRSLCLTCHKNHAAMFPRGPWQETNGDERVSKRILEYQPSGTTTYDGIPISATGNDIAHKFDLSTDANNLILPLNEIWTKWCGGETDRGYRCRANALKLGLDWMLNYNVDETSDVFKDFIDTLTSVQKDDKIDGFILPNFDLKTRDPFEDGTAAKRATELSAPKDEQDAKARLEDLIKTYRYPDDLEPANDASHVPPPDGFGFDMQWDDPPKHGKYLIYSFSRFFSPADAELLRQASGGDTRKLFNAVSDLLSEKSPALAARAIQRVIILNRLLQKLTPARKPFVSAFHNRVLGDAVEADTNLGVHEILGKDPKVANFWMYCRECHLKYPVDFSKAKKDEEILTVISQKRVAAKMRARLDWYSNPPPLILMPRKGSWQYRELKENDDRIRRENQEGKLPKQTSTREEMLKILDKFIGDADSH